MIANLVARLPSVFLFYPGEPRVRGGKRIVYAIIETGGKQYRVEPGQVVRVEKLDAEVGDSIEFDRVLMVSGDDGIKVGSPVVDGARVKGAILEHGKAKKIYVFKYKAKKRVRTKTGHRQPFTAVKIESISVA